jgi:hypothetical protein
MRGVSSAPRKLEDIVYLCKYAGLENILIAFEVFLFSRSSKVFYFFARHY